MPGFLQKDRSHRFTNNIAPAQNHNLRAGSLHARTDQQLLHTSRSARNKAAGIPQHELADIDGVKPVDIFAGIDTRINTCRINMRWQRGLNEDAVNGWIAVELAEQTEEFHFRTRFRQDMGLGLNSKFKAEPLLHANVDL